MISGKIVLDHRVSGSLDVNTYSFKFRMSAFTVRTWTSSENSVDMFLTSVVGYSITESVSTFSMHLRPYNNLMERNSQICCKDLRGGLRISIRRYPWSLSIMVRILTLFFTLIRRSLPVPRTDLNSSDPVYLVQTHKSLIGERRVPSDSWGGKKTDEVEGRTSL